MSAGRCSDYNNATLILFSMRFLLSFRDVFPSIIAKSGTGPSGCSLVTSSKTTPCSHGKSSLQFTQVIDFMGCHCRQTFLFWKIKFAVRAKQFTNASWLDFLLKIFTQMQTDYFSSRLLAKSRQRILI
ncbi:unnamed protein product [Albugo candida]|uniref:Uncharacterized protein n=1 Tax=Albugo candida TaxID=65357 RepID=A0A024FUY2_9STRA|nr:unnamed protein product [Albugo candida]|eukprot:CCI10930.1 unnamed protein product [Albugo candida]